MVSKLTAVNFASAKPTAVNFEAAWSESRTR